MSKFSDLPKADARQFEPMFRGFNPTYRRAVVLLPGEGLMNVATIIVTRVEDVERVGQQITLMLRASNHHAIDCVHYRKGDEYAVTGDGSPCAVVVDTVDGTGVELFLTLCALRYPTATYIRE